MDNELMRALIFNEFYSDSDLDINQRMTIFLENIPNLLGQDKKSFLAAMFIGGLYDFEYSNQKLSLENNKYTLKNLYYYDRINSILHLIFVVSNKQRYLRSIMIFPDKNTKFKLPNELKNIIFTHNSMIKIIYKKNTGFIWESPKIALSMNEISEDEEFILKLIQNNQKKFVLVKRLSHSELNAKHINEKQTELFGHNNKAVVQKAIRTYLGGRQHVYQSALEDLIRTFGSDLVESNCFSQGFLFGGLALVHPLKVQAELSYTANFIDIIVHRSTLQNPNPYPILFETYLENMQASEGIGQLQKFYSKTEIKLPHGNYNSHAFIVRGAHFLLNRSNLISINDVSITPTNQIISNFFLDKLSDVQCKENLKHLYYMNGYANNLHNYFLQLLGLAISFSEVSHTTKKYVYLWEDAKLHAYYGILAFNHESDLGEKKRLILYFKPKPASFGLDGQVTNKTESESIMEKNADSVINGLMSSISTDTVIGRYIYIEIDKNKNNIEDFFGVVRVNDNPQVSSNLSIVPYGVVKELDSLSFKQLFTYSEEEGAYDFYITNLSASVKKILSLIKQKIHFECLFHGIIAGLATSENTLVRFANLNRFNSNKIIDGTLKLIKQFFNKNFKEKKLLFFNFQYQPDIIKDQAISVSASLALDAIEWHAIHFKNFTQLEHAEAINLIIDKNKFLDYNFLTSRHRLIKIGAVTKDIVSINTNKLCERNIDQNKCSIISSCAELEEAFYDLSRLSDDEWMSLFVVEEKLIQELIKRGVRPDTIPLFKMHTNSLIEQLTQVLFHQLNLDQLVGYHAIETKYRFKKYVFFLILYNVFDHEIYLNNNPFDDSLVSYKIFNRLALNIEKYFIKSSITNDMLHRLKNIVRNPLANPINLAAKINPIGYDSFYDVLSKGKFKNWLIRNSQKKVEYLHYQVVNNDIATVPTLIGNTLLASLFLISRATQTLTHYTEVLNLSTLTKLEIFWKGLTDSDLSGFDLMRDVKIFMTIRLELIKKFLISTEGLKAVVWYSDFPVIHHKHSAYPRIFFPNEKWCSNDMVTKVRLDPLHTPIVGYPFTRVFTQTDLSYLNASNHLPLFPHYFGDANKTEQAIKTFTRTCQHDRYITTPLCKNLPSLEKDHEDRKLVSVNEAFIDKNVMPLLKQVDVGTFSWLGYPNGQPIDEVILYRTDIPLVPDRLINASFICNKSDIVADYRKFFYFTSNASNPIDPFVISLNDRDVGDPIFYLNGGFNSDLPQTIGSFFSKKFSKDVYSLKAADTNPAIIFVNEWNVYYIGSDQGTLFLLVDEPQGYIKGGVKQDIIDINNLNLHELLLNRSIQVDLANHKLSYFTKVNVKDNQLTTLDFFNIEIYKGHSNASESIFTDCDTEFVDGRGGGDLVVGSQNACLGLRKEIRIMNFGDIHYLDPYKMIIYDIQPNATVFLTYSNLKNDVLNYPQIILLNEAFSNLSFKKVFFDKRFDSEGELSHVVAADNESFDISYPGYVITCDNKRLLIDYYDSNILFITNDSYHFYLFKTGLKDYFEDINNQIIYKKYNKEKYNFYRKIIENTDTRGFKINLIKNINAATDTTAMRAIKNACDEVDRHENIPSIDSFTIYYSNQVKKITTYVFGSPRQSIFFADTEGDYYFKTMGLSNVFYIYPPRNLSNVTAQSLVQNIYIDKEWQLFSDKKEETILDLTEFYYLQRLTNPYLRKPINDSLHLQFKFSTPMKTLLALNIYLKNSIFLQIKLDDCNHEFDACNTDLMIHQIDEPYVSLLQSSPAVLASSWWPSIIYGFTGFALGAIAASLLTKSRFLSPYRLIPQVNPDRIETALGVSIAFEGLTQVDAFVQTIVKPLHGIPAHEDGKGLQIENNASTKPTCTTPATFQVDQPTFSLMRLSSHFFGLRRFNKRITQLEQKQQATANNDFYGEFMHKHEQHMTRIRKMGIA